MGLVVAIEGITNSGKTTFARSIAQALRPKSVAIANVVCEKDQVIAGLGAITNPAELQIDHTTEFLLYAAHLSRRVLYIRQLLKSHEIVIADRFCASLFAMHCSVRRLPEMPVLNIVEMITLGLRADITFTMETDLETVLLRSKDSPFSRKDRGISTYFSDYVEGLESKVHTYSDVCYRIPSNFSDAEVIIAAKKVLDHGVS